MNTPLVIAEDDSEIEIGGKAHTILVGLVFADEEMVNEQLREVKKTLGFSESFEIKWTARSPTDPNASSLPG